MKRYLFWGLVFLAVLILILRFTSPLLNNLTASQNRAGIRVTSTPIGEVFINGQSYGDTPYQNDNLTAGEIDIKIKGANGEWFGKATLNSGTITAVNRDLASDLSSSSGESMTLFPGNGVVVTSSPNGASVSIDGREIGITPVTVSEIPAGEHRFQFSKDGYLERNIMAIMPDKLSLHLMVDLSLSEMKIMDTPTSVPTQPQVIVKPNQLGFLRIRSQASLLSDEIGRVSPGDKLTLVEDQGSWLKVKLPNGAEGFVATSYIEKQ